MSPVFICGPSRSGTSLTAGLLAAHGIWFGPCVQPRAINQKGFFESVFLKEQIRNRQLAKFPDRWRGWLEEQNAPEQWGVKTGPEYYSLFAAFNPVVVVTSRRDEDILRSRKRAGFSGGMAAIRRAKQYIARLPFHTHTVFPDDIIRGDFTSFQPVLRNLGIEFSQDGAEEWIEPEMWSGYGR